MLVYKEFFSALYMTVYSAFIKTHHVRFRNGTMINVHFWYSYLTYSA